MPKLPKGRGGGQQGCVWKKTRATGRTAELQQEYNALRQVECKGEQPMQTKEKNRV